MNNHVDNLEWCSIKDNVNHAYDNDLHSSNIKIICLNNKKVFRSIRQACLWCGLDADSGSLSEYISGSKKRKSAGRDPITNQPLQWMLYSDYLESTTSSDVST